MNNTKSLSPRQAYQRVKKIAAKYNMSVSAYAEKHGVRKGTLSHWKCRSQKSVLLGTLEKLRIKV